MIFALPRFCSNHFLKEPGYCKSPKPLQKIIAIGLLPENFPAIDAANDNGMQRFRPI